MGIWHPILFRPRQHYGAGVLVVHYQHANDPETESRARGTGDGKLAWFLGFSTGG